MKIKPKVKRGESKGKPLSKALAERLCSCVANGEPLPEACQREGVLTSTVFRWMERSEELGKMYARACEIRLNVLEEKLFVLCNKAHEVACDELSGRERLQAVKLEIDTLKWYLSKLRRAKFGEKQVVEVTGKDGEKLETKADISPALLAEIAKMQAKMESKVKEESDELSANLADN